MYTGYIIGYIAKPNTNVYFVSTDRRNITKGESFDVVFSKNEFDLGDIIQYRITKRGKEFIAYA